MTLSLSIETVVMRTTFIALLACVVAPALVESAQHGVRAADPKKTFSLVEEESSPDSSSKEDVEDGATETINSKKTSDFSVEAPPAALAVAPIRKMMLSLVKEERSRKGRTNGDTSSEESESERSSEEDSITKKKKKSGKKKRKRRGNNSETTTHDPTRTPSPTPEPTPEPTPVPTPEPTPLNSDPMAVDDIATTNENTTVLIDALANDSDPDGDPLTIFLTFTGPQESDNGTIEIVDGQIKYTPDPSFSGNDSFTYYVSDGKGGTTSATVSITVNAMPKPTPPPTMPPTATP